MKALNIVFLYVISRACLLEAPRVSYRAPACLGHGSRDVTFACYLGLVLLRKLPSFKIYFELGGARPDNNKAFPLSESSVLSNRNKRRGEEVRNSFFRRTPLYTTTSLYHRVVPFRG